MRIRTLTDKKWYGPQDLPIVVELTASDKENIANMDPEAKFYVSFLDGVHPSVIDEWLRQLKEEG